MPNHPQRHWIIDESADTTICGIDFADEPDTLIACECRRPTCKYPVTCLVCRALLEKKIN